MFFSSVMAIGVFAQQKPAAKASVAIGVAVDVPAVKPADKPADPAPKPLGDNTITQYIVGIGDILDISVLQPDKLDAEVTVAPDGSVNFPYVGMVPAKGLSLAQIQDDIQKKLSDGYMKYPVVAVSLKQSLSKKFFVYGEVIKPGTYFCDESTTVLRAISLAGGFTKFGSSSNVKILRARKDKPGYDAMRVNVKGLMDGDAKEDILLMPDDILVVSEGMF